MFTRFLHIVLLLSAFALPVEADNLGYTKEHPLIFGIDLDYAPMEYLDEWGNPHGYDVEFTEKLMKRLNIPYTYAPNTWENIADDVLKGKVDLGMMVYSSYRKDVTNYSRAVFRLYYQLIYRKDEPRFYGLRHVQGKSIAFMTSRPIIDTLTKAGANIQIVKDLKRATYELARGKYDAVICYRYQAQHLIDVNHLENLQTEDLTLMSREYCYVSHDKNLIDAINVELDKMEEEGIIEDVYKKVKTDFGGLVIPTWVWFLIGGVIILSLILFIVIQNRHQKELKTEMERVLRSEQLKTVFLGNVSHALRTPLNAIIGFSSVLLDDKEGNLAPADRQQMLELVNNNGHQLLYFINELLELSNIEGNELLFERSEIDLAETMNEFASQIKNKLKPGVSIEVVGDGGKAVADVKLMRLVTMHALDNAAKFTYQGKITLSYRPENNGLRISVKDTGVGLPESLKNNLFELLSEKNTFVQSESPGLGLTICKAIVDRSGGLIGAESPPEGGTVIWHWVPIEVTH